MTDRQTFLCGFGLFGHISVEIPKLVYQIETLHDKVKPMRPVYFVQGKNYYVKAKITMS